MGGSKMPVTKYTFYLFYKKTFYGNIEAPWCETFFKDYEEFEI